MDIARYDFISTGDINFHLDEGIVNVATEIHHNDNRRDDNTGSITPICGIASALLPTPKGAPEQTLMIAYDMDQNSWGLKTLTDVRPKISPVFEPMPLASAIAEFEKRIGVELPAIVLDLPDVGRIDARTGDAAPAKSKGLRP